MFHGRESWYSLPALTALACWVSLGCENADPQAPGPRQAHRESLLSEEKLDDCAARFADALRRWAVVVRADAPVRLACPRWRNESPVAVQDGPTVARRLAEAIDLRTGAKVRVAAPGALGCHYGTELVLRPAKDGRGQPLLVLAWRVVRPGVPTPLLEEMVTVRHLKVPAPAGSWLAAKPPPAGARGPAGQPYQEIAFEHGKVHVDAGLARGRMRILGERAWRDDQDRLCVTLRVLSQLTDTTVSVLAGFVDQAGRRQAPTQGTRETLHAGRPTTLSISLPKTARRYELFVVAP